MKRRVVLLGGAAAAGALALGWAVQPVRQRLVTANAPPAADGEHALNGWVKIAGDGSVVVWMSKSEMGQGVHTGLAAVLAEELDADWDRVNVEMAPPDRIYNNLAVATDGLPFHPDNDGAVKSAAVWLTAKTMREIGTSVTGGSTSIKDLWLPMREAGASARAMLVAAAAAQWKVPASICSVKAGLVSHPSGKSAGFGELAALAAQQPVPKTVQLKDPATFTLAGRSLRRIEAKAKVDGSARFGIDVRPEGLLYASVAMCPTLGGQMLRFDAKEAQAMPGVKHVLAVDGHNGGTGGVAVIAETYFEAMRALAKVSVEWEHGPASTVSGDTVLSRLSQTLDNNDGLAYHSSGDVEAALAQSARIVEAEYRAPWLAHAAMEPINCTVQVTGQDKAASATVWASTQVPDIARRGVAKLLGVDAAKVDLQVQLLGGGFGRRLEADYVVQAAAIARAAEGKPVQTIWSREQDIRHDFYRPACVSRFRAGLDAAGKPVAWHNVSAGQAIVPHVLARSFGLPELSSPSVPDKTSSEGAFDQPYEWPAARVAHARVTLPVPVGFLRSVGHSHHAFFKESFVDELAAAAGQDPVAFRASLLARHPRHLGVLEKAAELSGWGRPLAPTADGAARARGVALHESFGSVVAQVAEVSLSAEKAVRVHRVTCVIDCGFPLNPNLIAQQMESGIVFGLSAALNGEITIRDGQVQQSNFHDYPVLRLPQAPLVQTHIMPSTAHPQGVGEPGTPPVAPAVANALFALTGQRLRSLPLRPA